MAGRPGRGLGRTRRLKAPSPFSVDLRWVEFLGKERAFHLREGGLAARRRGRVRAACRRPGVPRNVRPQARVRRAHRRLHGDGGVVPQGARVREPGRRRGASWLRRIGLTSVASSRRSRPGASARPGGGRSTDSACSAVVQARDAWPVRRSRGEARPAFTRRARTALVRVGIGSSSREIGRFTSSLLPAPERALRTRPTAPFIRRPSRAAGRVIYADQGYLDAQLTYPIALVRGTFSIHTAWAAKSAASSGTWPQLERL